MRERQRAHFAPMRLLGDITDRGLFADRPLRYFTPRREKIWRQSFAEDDASAQLIIDGGERVGGGAMHRHGGDVRSARRRQ